jgi:hypothetical protein
MGRVEHSCRSVQRGDIVDDGLALAIDPLKLSLELGPLRQ